MARPKSTEGVLRQRRPKGLPPAPVHYFLEGNEPGTLGESFNSSKAAGRSSFRTGKRVAVIQYYLVDVEEVKDKLVLQWTPQDGPSKII